MISSFGSSHLDILPRLTVRHFHGLGNIICLLPVLDHLHSEGYRIKVITRTEWLHTFSYLRPDFLWSDEGEEGIDLDDLDRALSDSEHRTDMFGHLLGAGMPFNPPRLEPPALWSNPFTSFRGCVLFAPESGHTLRRWPVEKAGRLYDVLEGRQLILVGKESGSEIACDVDLRGRLELHELFGLVALSSIVISLDSAVTQIAGALERPTVALFGGSNPLHRIRPAQKIVMIQSDMACCPCEEQNDACETIGCMNAIEPEDVIEAAKLAPKVSGRSIWRIQTQPNEITSIPGFTR